MRVLTCNYNVIYMQKRTVHGFDSVNVLVFRLVNLSKI